MSVHFVDLPTQTLFLDGKPLFYKRKELSMPPGDCIAWLESQPLFPKMYWKEKKADREIAAIGATYLLHAMPKTVEGPPVRFFGGMDFSPRRCGGWMGFPTQCYFLPRVEWIREGKRHALGNQCVGNGPSLFFSFFGRERRCAAALFFYRAARSAHKAFLGKGCDCSA